MNPRIDDPQPRRAFFGCQPCAEIERFPRRISGRHAAAWRGVAWWWFPVLVAAALVGCRPAHDTVSLEVWAIGSEGDILRKMLDDFHRRHPDLRVVVQQIPWNTAHEKLLTAFAGQALPDLCQLGNSWIPEFSMLGALDDLLPRVADSPHVLREDYFDGIWATNEIDGRCYGIPWYVDTRLLFYRHDLMREAGWESPPRTWADWKDAMQSVQRLMGPDGHAILLPTNEWDQLVILGMQMDEPLLRDGGRFGNFRSPSFRRAIEFYLGLYRDGLAPVVASTEISNVWQELAEGTYAMYITGPWNMGEFRRRIPAAQRAHWSTTAMPAPEAPGPGRSMAGGCSLVIFQQSHKKDEAWRLIEYLSDPEIQVQFYQRSGNLPARQTAWNDPALEDDPWASAFREQLQHVRPTPQVPEWERIAARTLEVADGMIRGSLTLESGLEQLDRDVDRFLEKRRWILDRSQSATTNLKRGMAPGLPWAVGSSVSRRSPRARGPCCLLR